jgi:hypothetical protein
MLVVEMAERVTVAVVVLALHSGVHGPLRGIGIPDVCGLYRTLAAAQMAGLAGLAAEIGQEARIALAPTVGLGARELDQLGSGKPLEAFRLAPA